MAKARAAMCELCDRACPRLTVHHLIPRQYAKRKKLAVGPMIDICPPCHKQIHALFNNQRLATELNSAARLRQTPELEKFLHWIRKQDPHRQIRTHRRYR
ncbi:MAG: HNH endonuclease [Synechococcales cyanobacterium RM1_1_8]|nr:HNH endonuclease [Synechococcales cyanobacterium RM1_1_8]